MSTQVFSIPIFFIIFRETLEAAVIVSVLLSFVKKLAQDDNTIYRKLRNQVFTINDIDDSNTEFTKKKTKKKENKNTRADLLILNSRFASELFWDCLLVFALVQVCHYWLYIRIYTISFAFFTYLVDYKPSIHPSILL